MTRAQHFRDGSGHGLFLALTVAILFPVLGSSVFAQGRTLDVLDTRTIGIGGSQEITVQRLGGTFRGKAYESLVIAEIRDTATGAAVSLVNSPIWRLDLRKAGDLAEPTGNQPNHAPWTLVPIRKAGRDVNNPIRWLHAGSLWFLTAPFGGGTSVALVDAGPDAVDLKWTNIQFSEFKNSLQATADVTVQVRLDASGYLELSLQVDLDNPVSGGNGVAIMSAEFPSLALPPIDAGGEPDPDINGWVDDVLVSPYHGGGLIPDPITALVFEDVNLVDGVELDFNKAPLAPYSPHRITYPAEVQTQFFYYYDLETVPDLGETWADYLGDGTLLQRNAYPSDRGGGLGIYVAAHDGGLNTKRLLQYAINPRKKNKPETHLGLAIRNFFQFDASDRAVVVGGNDDWTFYIGPGSPSTPEVFKSELGFPVTIRALNGSWFDAAGHYRDWFESNGGSDGLLRDGAGDAIPLTGRDDPGLPVEDQIPSSYLSMAGMFILAETGPDGFNALSEEAVGAQIVEESGSFTIYVREFLNWMRQGSGAFGGTPWFAVGHAEGMQNPDGVGKAQHGSGNEFNGNRDPRAGLVEFHRDLRLAEPAAGWDGSVLTVINRDSGRGEVATAPAENLARTERGVPLDLTAANDTLLTSYARESTVTNVLELVADSLSRFADPDGTEAQVDLVFLSGQSAAAKPDYSAWFHPDPWLTTAGGGGAWAEGLEEAYKGIRTLVPDGGVTPSPHLFTGPERLNEMTLKRCTPFGPTFARPLVADVDEIRFTGPGGHRALWEPVPMVTFLYHEYTLLRGKLNSHARYALHGLDPGSNFPPPDYEKSQRLVSHKLASDVLAYGRIPTLFVSGDRVELDWTFNNQIGVGPDDKADASFSQGEPMWFARQLVRTRITAQDFLIFGRRVKDAVLIEDASNTSGWYAQEIRADHHGADAESGQITEHPFSELSIPRLVHGTWAARGGAETPVGEVHVFVGVANPSQPSGSTQYDTAYRLGFDPRWWDLAPGQYVLRPHRFNWTDPPGPPQPQVVFNHDDTWIESGVRECPEQTVQFWSVSPVIGAAADPLTMEVYDRKDPVKRNRYLLYEVAVTNQDQAERSGVQVEVLLPAGVPFVDADGPTPWVRNGDTLTFAPVAGLPAGQIATFRVLLRPDTRGNVQVEARMRAVRYSRVARTESTRVR